MSVIVLSSVCPALSLITGFVKVADVGLPGGEIVRHRTLYPLMNALAFFLISSAASAQQPQTPQGPQAEASKPADDPRPADSSGAKDGSKPAPQKAESLSPAARLASARSVHIKRTGGSDIPYTVIGESLQGWGHFVLVDDPEKADLILEVESPEDTSGLTFGASNKADNSSEPDWGSASWLTKQTVSGEVKLSVRDARSGNVLWRAAEQMKSSLKRTSRENSLVEAGERLFLKFHDRIEPPPVLHR